MWFYKGTRRVLSRYYEGLGVSGLGLQGWLRAPGFRVQNWVKGFLGVRVRVFRLCDVGLGACTGA